MTRFLIIIFVCVCCNFALSSEKIVSYADLIELNGKTYFRNESTPFSGVAISVGERKHQYVYENGDLVSLQKWQINPTVMLYEGNFKNGNKHGLETFYLPSGVPYRIDDWVDGKRDGMSVNYYPNGKVSSEGTRKEGKVVGKDRCYDEHGVLDECDQYKVWPGVGRGKSPVYLKNNERDSFTGKTDGSYFYPDNQKWKIIDIERLNKKSTVSLGFLLNMLSGDVVFTNQYFTFRSSNSGGKHVIGACFKKTNDKVLASMEGRFQKVFGEEVTFYFEGRYLYMRTAELRIKLAKVKTISSFKHELKEYDGLFNHILRKYSVKSLCGFKAKTMVSDSDYIIKTSGDNVLITVKEGNLNPYRYVPFDGNNETSMIFLKGTKTTVDGCLIDRIVYQYSVPSDTKNDIFIIKMIFGSVPEYGWPCRRIAMQKRIPFKQVLQAVKKTDSSSKPFVKPLFDGWINQTDLRLEYNGTKLLFSELDSEMVVVNMEE